MRRSVLVLTLALFSGSSAWAIPQSLNFQGLLKESGVPVNATRDMTFKIYDAASGGTLLFIEAHTGANTVTVSTGVFNASIGDLTAGGIPLSVFSGGVDYIEVTVGATTLPRQKVTSVGNAFFAAAAANLSSNAAIQISSAVLTATGANQYSLQTSSGINVQNGGVTAPFFSGAFYGNGSGLTGLTGTDSSKVAKAGDTMTGQLTLSGSSLTVTGAGGLGVTYGVTAGSATIGGTDFVTDPTNHRVGLGTATPDQRLHLKGNNGAVIHQEDPGNSASFLLGTLAAAGEYDFYDYAPAAYGYRYAPGKFGFFPGGAGSVEIGGFNPNYKLQVDSGTVYAQYGVVATTFTGINAACFNSTCIGGGTAYNGIGSLATSGNILGATDMSGNAKPIDAQRILLADSYGVPAERVAANGAIVSFGQALNWNNYEGFALDYYATASQGRLVVTRAGGTGGANSLGLNVWSGSSYVTPLVVYPSSVALASGGALSLSGAAGTITTQSSVTASAFFGNGAGLTGLPPCTNCVLNNSTQTINGNTIVTSTLTVAGSLVVSGIDEQWQTGSAGNGSTGIRCKVFSTTLISSGTNISYTSDGVNGDSWTINKSGVYAISFHGVAGSPDNFAISHNNASCSTGASSLSESNTLCYVGPNSNMGSCSFVGWLVNGDILKAHQSGTTGISGASSFLVHRIY